MGMTRNENARREASAPYHSFRKASLALLGATGGPYFRAGRRAVDFTTGISAAKCGRAASTPPTQRILPPSGVARHLLLAVLFALTACSGSYVISSPECPPDDSLATQRHPLGCGIYVPKDTTEQGP